MGMKKWKNLNLMWVELNIIEKILAVGATGVVLIILEMKIKIQHRLLSLSMETILHSRTW